MSFSNAENLMPKNSSFRRSHVISPLIEMFFISHTLAKSCSRGSLAPSLESGEIDSEDIMKFLPERAPNN